MSEHGRIIGVTEKPLGSTLVGDTPAGATSLTVVDAAAFDDQTSGWLSVNDQVIAYSKVNDDTGIITLATGSSLAASADEGDKVLLYDPLFQTVAIDKRAQVAIDGPDDNSDAIDTGIALHLVDKIPTGLRGDDGESVILEDDAGDWKIIDVLGLGDPNATGTQFEDQDTFTADSGGDQTFRLSHRPAKGSVHLTIGGAPQPHTEFTVDYDTGIVTVPDTHGLLEAGDWFDFRYAYGVVVKTPFVIDWASGGWKSLGIPASDSTDRSAKNLNDSSWSTASAPFGDSVGQAFNYLPGINWAAPATTFTLVTALWLRRDLPDVPKRDLTVSVRCDNKAKVYWNGILIGTTTGTSVGEYAFTVPASSVASSNVLAVRGEDTGPAGAGNHAYLDVKVES